MSYTYEELAIKNKSFLWHPFTQMKDYTAENPLIIAKGEGIKLTDVQGKEYYDGISSVWLNVHGHNVPELNQAVIDQLNLVAHSTMLGMANIPAIRLAEELVRITPAGLTKVFYSDSGATGVEIALKMAFQYWQNRGVHGKTSFVTFNEAYHGDTLGAVSVGAIPLYHQVFKKLLFHAYTVPYPDLYRYEGSAPECLSETLDRLEKLLAERSEELAAIIIEPIVQGASGIKVMPPGCLKGIERLAKQYGVLLIADEVATGFGRTGAMFACGHEEVSPDLMVVAKGLTGGYLPLAATLATDEIYDAFYDDYEKQKTFFHGHSYTGNPLGCAVALANLKLMEDVQLVEQVARKSAFIAERLKSIEQLPHVGDIRQKGFMAGIELVRDKTKKLLYAWEERIGVRVSKRARELGMLTRPLGNVIVFLPPLVSKEEELAEMIGILAASIQDVTERNWGNGS